MFYVRLKERQENLWGEPLAFSLTEYSPVQMILIRRSSKSFLIGTGSSPVQMNKRISNYLYSSDIFVFCFFFFLLFKEQNTFYKNTQGVTQSAVNYT
jgi:hypothetical protein